MFQILVSGFAARGVQNLDQEGASLDCIKIGGKTDLRQGCVDETHAGAWTADGVLYTRSLFSSDCEGKSDAEWCPVEDRGRKAGKKDAPR